jgi:DNA repair exonuclease SbcCD ATPase subunit
MGKDLKAFQKVIGDLIGKEELTALLKKYIERMDERHDKDKAQILKMLEHGLSHFKEVTATELETYKSIATQFDTERATKSQADLQTALQTIKDKLAEVDERIANIRDGADADEEKILQRLAERLPKIEEIENKLPSLGERIRDSLELLQGEERIRVEAIDGLQELLEELTKKVSKAGGSSQLLINHWPRHEQFTMDGVATTVTLAEGVAAQGTAIFGVRWQGQTLDMTTHYTVDGNKITLVGITPSSGDIISVTYMS